MEWTKKLPGFEIMNGNYEMVGDPEIGELKNEKHYEAYRIKGTFFFDVNLKDYPFDKHNLEIHIENQELDSADAVYVPDYKNLKDLDKRSILTGWQTIGAKIFEQPHVYNTNWGKEEDKGSSTYSQLVYRLRIKRKILPYVIKYSIPLLVIVFMCFSNFFFKPSSVETRIAIVITAILSVVAFHISQASDLPEVGYLVTADHFFLLAYIFCALSMLEIIIMDMYVSRGDMNAAVRLDRKAKFLMPAFYVLSYVVILLSKL